MRALPLLLLLTGCATFQGVFGDKPCDYDGSVPPPISNAELRDAWVSHGWALPSPDCDPRFMWYVVSDADLLRMCGRVHACTLWLQRTSSRPYGCPATYTTESERANWRELATHEFAHQKLFCWKHDRDPSHTTYPEVWRDFDGSMP